MLNEGVHSSANLPDTTPLAKSMVLRVLTQCGKHDLHLSGEKQLLDPFPSHFGKNGIPQPVGPVHFSFSPQPAGHRSNKYIYICTFPAYEPTSFQDKTIYTSSTMFNEAEIRTSFSLSGVSYLKKKNVFRTNWPDLFSLPQLLGHALRPRGCQSC